MQPLMSNASGASWSGASWLGCGDVFGGHINPTPRPLYPTTKADRDRRRARDRIVRIVDGPAAVAVAVAADTANTTTAAAAAAATQDALQDPEKDVFDDEYHYVLLHTHSSAKTEPATHTLFETYEVVFDTQDVDVIVDGAVLL